MKDIYVITASFVGEVRKDFRGYLDMVKRAGYAGLELFGLPYEEYTPSEMKAIFDEYGLSAPSAHVSVDDTDKMLEYLPALGTKFMVCPGIHVESEQDAHEKAALLNRLGEKVKQYGFRYGYHNHNNDFDRYGDKTVIDIFLAETDPDLVTFELDAAWAWRAGVNAADFINAHAGRFDLIHVKETSRVFGPEDDFRKLFEGVQRGPDGRPIFTPELRAKMEEHRKVNCKLGDGIINMPELKKAADAQSNVYYIVEREYAYTGDNFTTLLEDREYLSKL